MSDELKLSEQDVHSALWMKITAYLETRIEYLRRRNDTDLSPDDTTRVRAQITELKKLLAAGDIQDQH